jgi:multiple sugar transport system substrate-binding protein
LANETVGKSFESYFFAGHQWALPIDAAAQVQAIRPDLLDTPFRHFADVLGAARDGRIVWPLRAPHNLMSFFTLAANIGAPCGVRPGELIGRAAALRVLEVLQALSDAVDPACHGMDPIAALDALAEGARFHAAPLCYLYATDARPGYRTHRLGFHDIPALGPSGPLGSALGGTGIAISASTRAPGTCTRFALWLAGAGVQSGLYAAHNGQPGNALAWGCGAVNAAVGGAYANTRMTHEAAWLRPRHPGYMAFQDEGSAILCDALQGRTTHKAALAALDTSFNESFQNV